MSMDLNAKFETLVEVIKTGLKKTLSATRYQHSLNVADMAVQLAKQWAVPVRQAYLAGLLHDSAKRLSFSQMHAIGIQISPKELSIYRDAPAVFHAIIAPKIIRKQFCITSPAILSAVKWHATGRAGMTVLDQILFVSDYIEPDRPFSEVVYIRELAFQKLDFATFALSQSLLYNLMKRCLAIYPFSFQCRNYYLKKIGQHQAIEITNHLLKVMIA